MTVAVIQSGALTTVQDDGRYGYQEFGVSVGGAMDSLALSIANLLVGNAPGTAALELTLIGPELRVETDRWLAICGGQWRPRIQDVALPMWRPVFIPAGSTIQFGTALSGCRAYVAFDGGVDVPSVLGGTGTHLRVGFGGFRGRALMSGDHIRLSEARLRSSSRAIENKNANSISDVTSKASAAGGKSNTGVGGSLPYATVGWFASPSWDDTRSSFLLEDSNLSFVSEGSVQSYIIRVIPGPEFASFTKEAVRRFFEEPYTIALQSDRMGYRLQGPKLEYQHGEMLSEAVGFGTIQVPADGLPIVLMADRQTTGGYPRIGQVASVDLPILAQRKPGDRIWFIPVTLERAEQLLWARHRQLAMFRLAVREAMKRDELL